MEVDFLILADRAEAMNGKLYMVGGGFDRVRSSNLQFGVDIDVAFGILVDYNETNERHSFDLTLENADNRAIVGPIHGEFEVGRPAGMLPGQQQRISYVVRGPFPIPEPGSYQWVVALDDVREKVTAFHVDQVLAAPHGGA
jgi:hypothetical protein